MIAEDGHHLSMVGAERADWYLTRKLAVEVPPPGDWPRAIRLTFTPSGRPKDSQAKWLSPRETVCVVCGATEDLTKHHIVPRMLRKRLPSEFAAKQDQWCALLCQKHHHEIERRIRPHVSGSPLYAEAIKSFRPDPVLAARVKMRALSMNPRFEFVETSRPDKVARMQAEAELLEIPRTDVAWAALMGDSEAVEQAAFQELLDSVSLRIIDEMGGPCGVQDFFRDMFLEMSPQFCYVGIMADRPNLRLCEATRVRN